MKVFIARREAFGRYNSFTVEIFTIVANAECEALGLALDASPESKASQWALEEIDLSEPYAHYQYEHEDCC